MKTFAISVVFAATLVAAGLCIMRLGAPQTARADAGCTAADLRGTFGYQLSGWFTPAPNAPLVPFAETGRAVATADGGFSGASHVSLGGQQLAHSFGGTSQVNPDCTGSVTGVDNLGTPVRVNLVILKGRKDVLLYAALPGGVANGRAERITE